MPGQVFSFEPNGPKRLEITWGAFWKDITIKVDDEVLEVFSGQKEFIRGREYTLKDGSNLKLNLKSSLLGQEILVSRNGKPLPGSAADPESRLKATTVLVFFIAFWNIIFGIIGYFMNRESNPQAVPYQFSLIIQGLIFIGLGFLVRKRKMIGIVLAMLIFAADSIYSALITINAGQQPYIFRVLLQAMILYYLYLGFKALREKQNEAAGLSLADTQPAQDALPQDQRLLDAQKQDDQPVEDSTEDQSQ